MKQDRTGRRYSDREWNEMLAIFDREHKDAVDWLGRQEAICRSAARMLAAAGIDGGYGLANRLLEFGLDGIRFSSQEKKEAVAEVAAWLEQQAAKL